MEPVIEAQIMTISSGVEKEGGGRFVQVAKNYGVTTTTHSYNQRIHK